MRALAVLGIITLLATPVAAQQRGTELSVGITGLDVDITGGQTFFQFGVRSPTVAVGLYPSPNVAIEPSLGVSVFSGGGASSSVIDFAVAVPIYASRTWGHSGFFVAPAVGVTAVSASGSGVSSSASQFSAGLGLGTKVRISNPVSLKVSAGFNYWFATSQFQDAITIGAGLGLSVFF
jgi:hypothetical protein